MLVIVGLGNPGAEYVGTRHNVGRAAVQRLAQRHGLEFPRKQRFRAQLTDGRIGDERCILALPETYMNRSGDSVGPLAGYYKVPPGKVVVVYDELDLPLCDVRLKFEGGHGGHNGIRDIQRGLGSKAFGRVRIGLGRPPGQMKAADFVLQRFRAEERGSIDDAVERAAEAIEMVARDGIEATMNLFNRRAKQEKESA